MPISNGFLTTFTAAPFPCASYVHMWFWFPCPGEQDAHHNGALMIGWILHWQLLSHSHWGCLERLWDPEGADFDHSFWIQGAFNNLIYRHVGLSCSMFEWPADPWSMEGGGGTAVPRNEV